MSVGALLLTATMVIGQNNVANAPTKARLSSKDPDAKSIKNSTLNDKTPGQVLWSEDFAGGFPAGWTRGGSTNSGGDGVSQSSGWVINSAPISATYTNENPLVSSTGGNHMLYFSEIVTPTFTDHDAWFQTTGIALNGAVSFTIKLEQQFRLCCASTAALDVEVSADPTFASGVFSYSARGATAINATAGSSTLAQTKYINISDNFGGSSATIYLRFHWNLGASHYYWMVDDIALIESPDNDLITFEQYHGTAGVNYTRIPDTQLAPIDFSTKVANVGGTDAYNVVFTAEVNAGATFTGTSTPTTVPALVFGGTLATTSDSLFSTLQWTPPATPLNVPYTIDFTVSSDSVDNTPLDNIFSFPPLEVDAAIYASDDFSVIPGNGGGYNNTPVPPTEDFEAGNYFDIVNTQQIAGIDVVVGSGDDGVGQVGAIFDVVLYDITSGSFVQVDRSTTHVVTAADTNNVVSLALPTSPTLTAGTTYFAAVHGWGGVGVEFFYGTSGTSPDNSAPNGATSLIFYPSMSAPNAGENFYTTRTPMVRLNFMAVGIEELTENVNFTVYPNPSAGLFNINLDAKVTGRAHV